MDNDMNKLIIKENVLLTEDKVRGGLSVPCDVAVYEEVGSTNEVAKTALLRTDETGKAVPLAVIADKQTAGKGRLGRKFESPAGSGLYMTFAVSPEYEIGESLFVTMAAAVGTARAIRKAAGKDAGIKWVNDLFYNGRKVCGILAEAAKDPASDGDELGRLVVGIGVNCFPGSFPPEVSKVAGALSEDEGSFSRAALASEMINETLPLILDPDPAKFLDEYREKCFILGRDLAVHRTYDDDGIPATALSVTDDGGLLVKYLSGGRAGEKAGTEEVLHTGEVSISL